MARRSLAPLALLLVAACAAGCGAAADDDVSAGGDALTVGPGGERIVYFHGMSHLGFAPAALEAVRGDASLLAPSLSDAQLEAPPPPNVLTFLRDGERGIVAGYSLGRIPVFRLMQQRAAGMKRVVLIDPTYDSASGIGQSIGGGIGRAWLDDSEDRTLFLVYGDVTKSLGGERSYETELGHHPRAELCYVPGDHARFRQPDMAHAIVAHDCADLKSHLDP